MKIKNLLRAVSSATLILTCTLGLNAQDDNLVPNGGFEDTNIKKLKILGTRFDICPGFVEQCQNMGLKVVLNDFVGFCKKLDEKGLKLTS